MVRRDLAHGAFRDTLRSFAQIGKTKVLHEEEEEEVEEPLSDHTATLITRELLPEWGTIDGVVRATDRLMSVSLLGILFALWGCEGKLLSARAASLNRTGGSGSHDHCAPYHVSLILQIDRVSASPAVGGPLSLDRLLNLAW
jgi:hypothetical protein